MIKTVFQPSDILKFNRMTWFNVSLCWTHKNLPHTKLLIAWKCHIASPCVYSAHGKEAWELKLGQDALT